MTKSQVTKMEWKKEFNTKFGKATLNDDMGGHYIGSYLIEFIENLLTLSESRVKEEAYKKGYEDALQQSHEH